MICNHFGGVIHRGLRLSETNELGCDSATLVHQLIETMLAIRSWFTQNDRAGVNAFIEADSALAASLTIALHVKLLDVSREAEQSLTVGEDCSGLNSTNMGVVESNKAHHSSATNSQVTIEG